MKGKIILSMLLALLFCVNTVSVFAETEPSLEPVIIEWNLDSVVSKDPEFTNGGLVYSDKYEFALETLYRPRYDDYIDLVIIYGIKRPDIRSMSWENEFRRNYYYINSPMLYIECASGIFHQIQGVVSSTGNNMYLFKFFEDELPFEIHANGSSHNSGYYPGSYMSIPEANEYYGFDVEKYIYPYYFEDDCRLGDANGDGIIDPQDAGLVLGLYSSVQNGYAFSAIPYGQTEYLKDFEVPPKQKSIVDVNGDGIVDPQDAALILSYYAYVQNNGQMSAEEFFAQ